MQQLTLCTIFVHFTFFACSSCSSHLANVHDEASRNCCGPGCRTSLSIVEAHYDKDYFKLQNRRGQIKATRDWQFILRLTGSDYVVADFGCGGGWILSKIDVQKRLCVEFSDVARKFATDRDPRILAVKYVEQLEDNYVDVIYSQSVLEHVECPIQELREIYKKLKVGGRLVIGIKNEGVELYRLFSENDKNFHLYTWNNANVGNMVKAAGFRVLEVEPGLEMMRNSSIKWQAKLRSIVNNGFGRFRHTFVFYYVHAVKV